MQATAVALLNVFKDGFGVSECEAGNTTCYKESQPLTYPCLGKVQALPFIVGMGGSSDVARTIERVALSITKWMRDCQFWSSLVLGVESRMIVFTRVQWAYLVFPATVLLLGLVFVIVSMWGRS